MVIVFCEVYNQVQHMSELSVPSQMYYHVWYNVPQRVTYIHAHLSKLSIPSQMYYGNSNIPQDFVRYMYTCMHTCPSCQSHPKCTVAPPQDSVWYTCPSYPSHPKCTMVTQRIPRDS